MPNVMTSVMPQGVEHFAMAGNDRTGRRADVMTSVMPQGVEHRRWPLDAAACRRVTTSVMPQGVEHLQSPAHAGLRSRDDLRDAARR